MSASASSGHQQDEDREIEATRIDIANEQQLESRIATISSPNGHHVSLQISDADASDRIQQAAPQPPVTTPSSQRQQQQQLQYQQPPQTATPKHLTECEHHQDLEAAIPTVSVIETTNLHHLQVPSIQYMEPDTSIPTSADWLPPGHVRSLAAGGAGRRAPPLHDSQVTLAVATPTPSTTSGRWVLGVAAQTTQGVRDRMSAASDQLNISIRQIYASASNIADQARPPSYHNIPGIVPYYHGRVSGPPPSYDDVINPYAPPPTYQSLFGQMRAARKTSRGLIDLLRKLLIILISTLGCTIIIAFMILIPFTMIIVGAVYIDECRVEHIPAFLLVGGLVWASKNIIHCYSECKQQTYAQGFEDLVVSDPPTTGGVATIDSRMHGAGGSDDRLSSTSSSGNQRRQQRQQDGQAPQQRSPSYKRSLCEKLLNCVLVGWFIAGCVIVFRNYEPDFDNQESARYCHRTVYMYTFWLITTAIVVFSLFIGCICCLMVSSAIASRQEEEELG